MARATSTGPANVNPTFTRPRIAGAVRSVLVMSGWKDPPMLTAAVVAASGNLSEGQNAAWAVGLATAAVAACVLLLRRTDLDRVESKDDLGPAGGPAGPVATLPLPALAAEAGRRVQAAPERPAAGTAELEPAVV